MKARVRKPERAPATSAPKKPLTYEEQVLRRVERKVGEASLGGVIERQEGRAASHREQNSRRIDVFDRTCNSLGQIIYRDMPRGKYKDWPLEDIPTDYLLWCLENWTDEDGLIEAIEKEYRTRADGY